MALRESLFIALTAITCAGCDVLKPTSEFEAQLVEGGLIGPPPIGYVGDPQLQFAMMHIAMIDGKTVSYGSARNSGEQPSGYCLLTRVKNGEGYPLDLYIIEDRTACFETKVHQYRLSVRGKEGGTRNVQVRVNEDVISLPARILSDATITAAPIAGSE